MSKRDPWIEGWLAAVASMTTNPPLEELLDAAGVDTVAKLRKLTDPDGPDYVKLVFIVAAMEKNKES